MKTLAAVLEKCNEPLKLYTLNIPPLKKGEVLVKIAYTGLCHSQLNEIDGKKGVDHYLPHTLGHEGSGVIINTGEGVTKVEKDDHVVLSWIKGSGLDVKSVQYHHQDQVINSGAISTFMTHAIIAENRVIPIPKSVPLKEAALLGCALPTGMGIVFNTLQCRLGSSIAIFGVGGIGMAALIAANALCSSEIIAVDIHDHKLQLAKELGATHVINAKEENPLEKIKEITGNRGVDYAIEAAGHKNTMETAFSSVRPQGGTCVLAGNLPHNEKIEINPFDLIAGKKIIGTWGGESDIEKDIALYVKLYQSKKINIAPLISKEFSLQNINEAVTALKKGSVTRALVSFE